MADAVQALMEEMVPELQQFEEHGILSKAEVRALVKKRTDFEYRLRRRAAERRDFERYIEYEITLERLLKTRRDRLGIKKGKGTGKFSCVKHIHFIFDRAVKKFRGDVDLWLEWIAYAKSETSSKVLSKIFARALQLHPRNAKLWVHAAAYEWDMGNVTASRALLQRGIRLNSKAEELWREYFRMEVLFTARLAERRRVLGLGKEAKKAVEDEVEESAIAIENLDEENKGDPEAVALPTSQTADAGLEELLAGSIPKAVVRYARETMGSSPHVFFAMYDMCYLAGDAARSQLEEEILTVIDGIVASPSSTVSSIASSEAAVAAAAGATAAAITGTATRRAARAMANFTATSGEEVAACDAAQKVLDAYLQQYLDHPRAALSPQASPRKKAAKAHRTARTVREGNEAGSSAESGNEVAKEDKALATAMWQAVCGFWGEVEAQSSGKSKGLKAGGGSAARHAAGLGRNPELAKEAGIRAWDALEAARKCGAWTEDIALESIRRTLKRKAGPSGSGAAGSGKGTGKRGRGEAGEEADAEARALAIASQAVEHLDRNTRVAAEYLRLLARSAMSTSSKNGEQGREREALDSVAASMDKVLERCGGAAGAHELWADRVQLELACGADVEKVVEVFLRAARACNADDAAQVAIAGFTAIEATHGHQLVLRAGRALLARPLPAQVKGTILESLCEGELNRREQGSNNLRQRDDFAAARSLLEMWAADDKAKANHELWLRWELAERDAGEHKRATGVHWRALRTLEDADAYHRARAAESHETAATAS